MNIEGIFHIVIIRVCVMASRKTCHEQGESILTIDIYCVSHVFGTGISLCCLVINIVIKHT